MSCNLDLPQGLPTLARARPGQRVLVRAVLWCGRCPPPRLGLNPGERLRCTESSPDELEFEKANGTRFRIVRAYAEHVQVDRCCLGNGEQSDNWERAWQ